MSRLSTLQAVLRTSAPGAAMRSAVLAALWALSPVPSAFAEVGPPGLYFESDSSGVTTLGGGPGFVLLDQVPNESCLVIADVQFSISHAEDFVLPVSLPFPIDHLVFTGGYLFDNIIPPLGSDRFTVRLLPDSAGLPGAPLCELSQVIPRTRIDTGRDQGGFDIFEFTLDLNWTCQPGVGTYWIEIFEETAVDDAFSWECGDVDPISGIPNAAFANETPGMVWMAVNLDHAILLSAGGIFSDGFESGDTSAWSVTVP